MNQAVPETRDFSSLRSVDKKRDLLEGPPVNYRKMIRKTFFLYSIQKMSCPEAAVIFRYC